jgi:hypothetical protein
MNRNIAIGIVVIVLIIGGVFFTLNNSNNNSTSNNSTTGGSITSTTPTPTPAPTPAPAATATCIITIDGLQYDVEPLRKRHPGGDIYNCGTDMSDIFHGQHGNDIGRLAPYKVNVQ